MLFTEVADRVWVARQEWYDVNVTVVGGERGLVVIDTHASSAAARALADDVRRLGRGPGAGEVVALVNTHWHLDHTFGNHAFLTTWPKASVHAHEVAAEELTAWGEDARRAAAADHDDPHADELRETRIVVPDRLFSAAAVIDLGDRYLELVHPGPGHTGGDAVVRVDDVDVVLAGDLVEQSDRAERGGVPGFGRDCHPLAWPATLDVVLDLLTPSSLVVPGHGHPVDRTFVEDQRNDVGLVAQGVRDLAASGVAPEAALAQGEWPYPREHLAEAVRRGYAALPRGGRRLPLA